MRQLRVAAVREPPNHAIAAVEAIEDSQRGVRELCDNILVGANPLPRARSSADRASVFGTEGRGFESLRARQHKPQ